MTPNTSSRKDECAYREAKLCSSKAVLLMTFNHFQLMIFEVWGLLIRIAHAEVLN